MCVMDFASDYIERNGGRVAARSITGGARL
jgi:hypothetical protein